MENISVLKYRYAVNRLLQLLLREKDSGEPTIIVVFTENNMSYIQSVPDTDHTGSNVEMITLLSTLLDEFVAREKDEREDDDIP